MTQFRKGSVYPQPVGGAIVPKEYIDGCSLQMIENILGFRNGRLKDGAIVVQLDSMITSEELDYYGDTRAPFDQFEEKRNEEISHPELSMAAFSYIQATTKLVKVIPLDDPYSIQKENQFWPSGRGAMQYKLKEGIKKSATIIDVIGDYPNGTFRGV